MGNYIIQTARPDGVLFVRDNAAEPIITTSDVKLACQWLSEGVAIIKARALPATEGWNVVELDDSGNPINLVVERDQYGLYVEIQGTRFRGDDLPGEGTSVLSASTYCDDSGRQIADVEWSGDSPSGRCAAVVQEL